MDNTIYIKLTPIGTIVQLPADMPPADTEELMKWLTTIPVIPNAPLVTKLNIEVIDYRYQSHKPDENAGYIPGADNPYRFDMIYR